MTSINFEVPNFAISFSLILILPSSIQIFSWTPALKLYIPPVQWQANCHKQVQHLQIYVTVVTRIDALDYTHTAASFSNVHNCSQYRHISDVHLQLFRRHTNFHIQNFVYISTSSDNLIKTMAYVMMNATNSHSEMQRPILGQCVGWIKKNHCSWSGQICFLKRSY